MFAEILIELFADFLALQVVGAGAIEVHSGTKNGFSRYFPLRYSPFVLWYSLNAFGLMHEPMRILDVGYSKSRAMCLFLSKRG